MNSLHFIILEAMMNSSKYLYTKSKTFLMTVKKCNQNSRLVDKSQKADNGKTPKMVQASTDSFKSLELKHQDPLTAQTLTSKVNFGINHVSNMQIFGI